MLATNRYRDQLVCGASFHEDDVSPRLGLWDARPAAAVPMYLLKPAGDLLCHFAVSLEEFLQIFVQRTTSTFLPLLCPLCTIVPRSTLRDSQSRQDGRHHCRS